LYCFQWLVRELLTVVVVVLAIVLALGRVGLLCFAGSVGWREEELKAVRATYKFAIVKPNLWANIELGV